MTYSIKEILRQKTPFVLFDLTTNQSKFQVRLASGRGAAVYNPKSDKFNRSHVFWPVEEAPKCFISSYWGFAGDYVAPEDAIVFEYYDAEQIDAFFKNAKAYSNISRHCALLSKVTSIADFRLRESIGENRQLAGLIFDLDSIRRPFDYEPAKIMMEFEVELAMRLKNFAKITQIPWAVTGRQLAYELENVRPAGPLYWKTQGELMSDGIDAICAEHD